jgi:DNA-binding response OmpR family regulator
MKTPNSILYIEDNEDYVEFVKRAIDKIDIDLNCEVVTHGTKAINLFEKASEKKFLPKIILLDINLPGYNGLEILKKIKSLPATKYIPVIMFSSSQNQKDMMKAFDIGANAYIVKPMGIAPLNETLKSICTFWLQHNYSIQSFSA